MDNLADYFIDYVDAKIKYEFSLREEGADGPYRPVVWQKKEVERTEHELRSIKLDNHELLEALKLIDKAFTDGDLRFTKKRRSDSDPYHPANIKMCAAIAKAEGREP